MGKVESRLCGFPFIAAQCLRCPQIESGVEISKSNCRELRFDDVYPGSGIVSSRAEGRIVERRRPSFHRDEVPKKSNRSASTSRSMEA